MMGVQRTMKNCCCGCSLKTGATIIGTLSAINGAFSLVMFMPNVVGPHPRSFLGNDLMLVFSALVSLVQLLMGILLVVGADRSRPAYVHPWLGFSYFKIALEVVGSAFTMYYLIASHTVIESVLLFIAAVSMTFALQVYCIMVVFSFYKQLTGTGGIIPLKEEV